MAMTKKEQGYVTRLQDELARARAMRWPDYPRPEPMTQAEIAENKTDRGTKWGRVQLVARGWFYNAYTEHVSCGCSDGMHHSRAGAVTEAHGMGEMYKTELEAWQTLRFELTKKYADTLARIDRRIAEVRAEQ